MPGTLSPLPGLDAALAARFREADGSEASRDARRAAWTRFASLPVPTARDEAWNRTDPALLDFDSVRPVDPLAWSAGPIALHPLDASFAVVLSLGEDGLRVNDRAGAIRDGLVQITPLVTPTPVGEEADSLACALGAFWNAGLSIRVPAGSDVDGGVLVRGRVDRSGTLWLPRIEIEVGANSRLLFAHAWESGSASSSMLLGSVRVAAQEGARVRGVFLQRTGRRTRVHFSEHLFAARDASIDWSSLQMGAAAARLTLDAGALGPGADLRLRGLCLADGHRQIEQVTRQDHQAKDTTSHLLFKSIVRDAARSVFRGVIRARPGAVRIDAFQKNDHLLLDPGARAESLPGLRIDSDDLKCTHGATMGHPDPAALFYLRSRGLTLPEARALLVEGFAGEILSCLPATALGAPIRRRLGFRGSLIRVKAQTA
jgi:Fe-S cluster assembly protein SufD